jgi:hypothetical protein
MAIETSHTHAHEALSPHSHNVSTFSAVEHGQSHEILDGPGSYWGREMPLIEGRDWKDRAFTVGIGGYVSCHRDFLRACPVVELYLIYGEGVLMSGGAQAGRFWKDSPHASPLFEATRRI